MVPLEVVPQRVFREWDEALVVLCSINGFRFQLLNEIHKSTSTCVLVTDNTIMKSCFKCFTNHDENGQLISL